MDTTTILDLVQQRIGQDSTQTANHLVNSVLETLAERDLGGAHDNFAAELPGEFGQILLNPQAKTREHFDAAEFVRRVAERADISEQQSETWTRAAVSALVENVTTEERLKFVSALPEDLARFARWDV